MLRKTPLTRTEENTYQQDVTTRITPLKFAMLHFFILSYTLIIIIDIGQAENCSYKPVCTRYNLYRITWIFT